MPKEGYTTVTISTEAYEKMARFIKEYNKKLGYKRFRSVAQLTEEAVGKFLQEIEREKS